jgi:hypothetical protein
MTMKVLFGLAAGASLLTVGVSASAAENEAAAAPAGGATTQAPAETPAPPGGGSPAKQVKPLKPVGAGGGSFMGGVGTAGLVAGGLGAAIGAALLLDKDDDAPASP